MKEYRYNDNKSDKFWRIEYIESNLLVNYGKTGTIGKFQIKEFDSTKECEKEADKLISSKTKKGYCLFPDFEANNCFYFDDQEIGLHALTSHPRFRENFTNDFYFDCGDEEAPFGSDEGSDTLAQIEEDLRKGKKFDFITFPKKLIEEYWDMTYIPANDISLHNIEELLKTDEMNLIQSDMVTYATAFAQIKITGHIDNELKRMALNAMKRLEIVAQLLTWNTTGKPSEIRAKMMDDLEHFTMK